MARRNRRTRRSNRRLPITSSYPTPRPYDPIATLTHLLGPPTIVEEFPKRQKRRLAKISAAIRTADNQFRKEFNDPHSRWILRKTAFKLARPAPTSTAAAPGVCVSRQSRKEVMFATNKAGKAGQKRPVWTKNSKVRC